jgi:hypothetical protein
VRPAARPGLNPGRAFFSNDFRLALALACAACTSNADHAIRGTVIDAETKQAIEGVTVSDGTYAPKLAARSTTDDSGKFLYFSYPEEHTIVASKEGYADVKLTIGCTASDSDDLKIELTRAK